MNVVDTEGAAVRPFSLARDIPLDNQFSERPPSPRVVEPTLRRGSALLNRH